MASLAQDPTVLKVAELLEVRQRLDRENADLTKEVARHKEEREDTRKAFERELMALREAADSAATRRLKAAEEAAVEAKLSEGVESMPARVRRLREEIREERQLSEERLTERTEEATRLREELGLREEQLRLTTEASVACAARAEPLDMGECRAGGDALSRLRSRCERLASAADELRSAKAVASQEAEALRVEHDQLQQQCVEADAQRATAEAELQREILESKAGVDKLNTQLANAREHCLQLRADLQSRSQGAYEARLARKEAREQGVQTKYPDEDVQLRKQVRELSEELEQLKERRTEQSPWWALCLRPGSTAGNAPGGIGGNVGAALMRGAALLVPGAPQVNAGRRIYSQLNTARNARTPAGAPGGTPASSTGGGSGSRSYQPLRR
mmetsp:Transcript_158968/g.281784  ORF Transcript_158968/g.281784 Transcript_158968/m.281784 type:complete len:389 (+) Transcript_158968:104-1270(+)